MFAVLFVSLVSLYTSSQNAETYKNYRVYFYLVSVHQLIQGYSLNQR